MQTTSRADFRRILGLDNEEFEPFVANNRPPLYGGYEAVYFDGFDESNTSLKPSTGIDKPIKECQAWDIECFKELPDGTKIPEIELFDCKTGEKILFKTGIREVQSPISCTQPKQGQNCFRIYDGQAINCNAPATITYKFMTQSEAVAEFEKLEYDRQSCKTPCSSTRWTNNGWRELGSGYVGIRRQETWSCLNEKNSTITTASASITQCAGQISCHCRHDKELYNTGLGLQYSCYDTDTEKYPIPCVELCAGKEDDFIEVIVCSTPDGVEITDKNTGEKYLKLDRFGYKI